MFWFQAASVASDGARGESDAGGAGKSGHEPRSPDGASPAAALAGPAARSGTEPASATPSTATMASVARPRPRPSDLGARAHFVPLSGTNRELAGAPAACSQFPAHTADKCERTGVT